MPEVDRATVELQHRVQLGLLRALEAQLAPGGDRAEAGLTLERLLEFTEMHFAAEETLMRLHAYPHAAAHAEAHQRLLGEVLAIGQEHLAGDDAGASEVARRLRAWLREHILGMDGAFDAWCDQNGVAME
ncbi:MAG TPA: hemerythrin family protein [Anaeromyxobacteraceae bacterium]|nr:hemerythrin family protein [Anaeromyxobacteraceae bacterium]